MAGTSRGTKSAGAGFPPWSKARLAPVVLLLGKQRVFADRAILSLRKAAVSAGVGDIDLPEITEVDSLEYSKGSLGQLLSPSLFGGKPVVIVRNIDAGSAELRDDLVTYLNLVETGKAGEDAYLILSHTGSNTGRKIVDLCKSGVGRHTAVYSCDDLKWDNEKVDFLLSEARAKGRGLEHPAAIALVDAMGEDFAELLAVTGQLLSTVGDPSQPLNQEQVETYLRGRVEASGFDVADAAARGDVQQALGLLRHALATGVAEVLITGAMAAKLRMMLRLSASLPSSVQATGWLGQKGSMLSPPSAVKKAKAALPRWSEHRLAEAVQAVAQADENLKGSSKDPQYALEAMVLQVCRLARGTAR